MGIAEISGSAGPASGSALFFALSVSPNLLDFIETGVQDGKQFRG
jgi:hypothetical protein